MRIGIDISSAIPTRTGIGVYTWELVRRLIRQRDHEWVLLFNSLRQPPPPWPELREPHVRLIRRRVPGPMLLRSWQWIDGPSVETLAGGAVDVFHSPATYIPPQRRGARVTTIHDLHFLKPEVQQEPLAGRYLQWVLERRAASLHAALTPSPSVARETAKLLTKLGGHTFSEVGPGGHDGGAASFPGDTGETSGKSSRPPDRPVFAISHGVDDRFFEPWSEKSLEDVRRRYDLPQRFLLHLGGDEPRKNLPRLMRALRKLGKEAPPLVMVGKAGAGEGSQFLARYPVGHDDLPAFYRLATALAFPSLHEGFGMPVLEAMACGCPVLTSNGVAALEFLPDGAVVACDPNDENAIAQMIATSLADGDNLLAMGHAGPAVARKFTWDQAANHTLEAYKRAVALAT